MKKNHDENFLTEILNGNNNYSPKNFVVDLLRGKFRLKCKNARQKEYARLIDKNQITLCIGPAGVGKSYLSIIKALEMLKKPDNGIEKMIIITPVVESDEKLGYLKGTLEEKLSPYLYSTYYLIDKIIGEEKRKKLVELGIIKPLAIAYLRGVNIDNSVVVFEEAQNATKNSMKTFLTRIGFNTKFIISGDIEQIDRFRNSDDSGLKDVLHKLDDVDDVGIMEFDNKDVVRNPLISKILDKYN